MGFAITLQAAPCSAPRCSGGGGWPAVPGKRAQQGRPVGHSLEIGIDEVPRGEHLAGHLAHAGDQDVDGGETLAQHERSGLEGVEDALVHLRPSSKRALEHRIVAEAGELDRDHRFDHAGIVGEPGEVNTAQRIADGRADPSLRELVREVKADSDRLGDEHAVVDKRGDLFVRVRVRRIGRARSVHARDVGVNNRIGRAYLLEQPEDSCRARLRGMVKRQHRWLPLLGRRKVVDLAAGSSSMGARQHLQIRERGFLLYGVIMVARSAADYIHQAEMFGARNYAPLKVVLCRGEGVFVWDVDGKRYVDMLSAYSAVSQGHNHPKIVEALVAQAGRLSVSSRAFHNDRMGDMLEAISRLSGFEKILPMNTGAEAVETAIKAMRRFAYEKRGVPDGTAEIVVASGNFHGRTTTIVGFSDEPEYSRHFGPPTPGFVIVPFGDAAALAKAIGPATAGVLLEPIQGEAGVRIPPSGYLQEARRLCDQSGALLCFDEIQTGLGRTGKMFAFEHEAARPDLLVLGKALSGGLYPVSCLAANASVMDVFTPGSHGSTYGGNPLASAVCVAAIGVLVEEELASRSAYLGAMALERLRRELSSPAIVDVRGRGLMMAIEWSKPVAHEAAEKLAAAGILAKDTHGTTIRLMPPLVIAEEELQAALDIAVPVLKSVG